MITEKEWNQAFEHIVPTVSLAVGTLSVVLAIMALTRSSPLGHGQYLVSVRYPGQWNDIRDFVQPTNPDMVAIYGEIGPDPWALYDFVCRNIDYKRDVGEFWQTPSETLASKRGDCEDTSLLLCSLLQNAHVSLGSYHGYGHAWCQLNGEILETTYTLAKPVPDPQDYCPYVIFNDQEVIELWPGALGEMFELRRDEELKLNLMAEVLEAKGVFKSR